MQQHFFLWELVKLHWLGLTGLCRKYASEDEVYGFSVNGKEYGVIGSTVGTHIVDVTDPINPFEHTMLPGAFQGVDVIHRDYHIMDNYLYAVCYQGESTLQIIDISDLPNSLTIVYDSDTTLKGAHNIFIDTTTKKLFACWAFGESNSITWQSGLRVYDLNNPIDPIYLYDIPANAHDIWVENDTAYVNIPGIGLEIWDFTSAPIMIGSLTNYPFKGTNHSGWKKDNIYIFADEDHGADVKLIDASIVNNLSVTALINSGVDPSSSIVHNIIMMMVVMKIVLYHE